MVKNKKKSFIMLLVLIIVTLILITIFFIMPYIKPSASLELQSEKYIDNCNPYEFVTDYIPMQIPSLKSQNDKAIFHQISNIDTNTDKIVDNLYSEYSANLSEGIKECYPEFDEEGKVSFSRISDDDYERYEIYQDYIGDKGTDMLINLFNMTENRNNSIGCTTFQKNLGVELVLLSMVLYGDVEVNVLISKDFSKVQSVYDNNTYRKLDELFSSGDSSSIVGINIVNVYHYQQRIFRKDTDSTTEEQIIYYTYFKKDELEYIIQYKSNYTVLEGQKEYRLKSNTYTQEEYREMLLSVLRVLIVS